MANGTTQSLLPIKRKRLFPDEPLVIHLGARDYAIEHTGIEPFSGFVRMTSEADWRLSPIETEVRKRLSNDATFQLALPIGALAAQKGKALLDTQTAIVEWVISTVPKLPKPAQLRGSFRASSFERTETPFHMRLDRLTRPLPGKSFFVVHYTNETSLEQLRVERIRETLRKKLPKLQIWARRGARTVLILEDIDIAVTNEALVSESLINLRSEHNFWPDEIHMISTFLDDFWAIHALWLDDKNYFDLSDRIETRTTVDPRSLLGKLSIWDDFFSKRGINLAEREHTVAQRRGKF